METRHSLLHFVSYPWSHSLIMSIVWGVLLGAIVRALGASLRGAGIARRTTAKDRTGKWAFIGLVVFLFLVYIANVLGPPPPSTKAVAISALALWLIPLWGVWIERHREMSFPR